MTAMSKSHYHTNGVMRTSTFTIPALLIAGVTLGCKSPSEKQLEKIFPEMMVEVNLPTAHSGKSLQKATEDCSCGYILVGPRKKQFLSLRQEYRDSIFIQVNDVLIGLDMVGSYLNELRVNDGPRVAAFLFVDHHVPQDFINRIIASARSGPNKFVPVFLVTDNDELQTLKVPLPAAK